MTIRVACSRSTAALLLTLALAAWVTPGIAQDKGSAYYEDALSRYERRDVAGAIIQLKNALQRDPRNLAANILLGKVYLANGQPADAQDALEKALAFGADRSEVVIPLAQALLAQGKSRDLLARFAPESLSGARRAELLTLRGQALRQEGQLDAAAAAFQEARAIDPGAIQAWLAHADMLAKRGRLAEARKLLDEAGRQAPSDARVFYLRGTVAQASGNVAGALEAYERALTIEPGLTDARIARASLLLDLGRDAAAAPDIEFLKRESPREPRGNYLRAVYLSRKGDADGALSALTDVTQFLDPVPVEVIQGRAPELLLLGALAHHALGSSQKARGYLEQFLQVQPNQVGARKLLGTILLKDRDYAGAIKVLEPAAKAAPNDAGTFALLANAYLARGKTQQASRYLERALELGATTPDVQTALGLSLLSSGQRTDALRHLESAFAQDASMEGAGVALALVYIRQGRVKEAVDVAARMSARYPSNLALLNLLGIAKAAAGDETGARSAYEKAIRLDPRFTPAHLNLARLEADGGKLDAARARLTRLVTSDPKNAQAMFELARVEDRAGRSELAVRWLEKARVVEPRDLKSALALVELHLRRAEAGKALEVARGAQAFAPENLDVLAALSSALVANGDTKGGQAVLAKMTRLAEFDPSWQYRIAVLQMRAGNPGGAAYSLDKALSGNPGYLPAQVLQVEVDLARGDLDRAEAVARRIAKENPAQAVGDRAVASVALRRGNAAQALASYRAALAKEPSTQHVLGVYQATLAAEGMPKATAFLEEWTKSHPGDPVLEIALAEAHLRAGNLSAARTRFERVARDHGENAYVLNNLANIAARLGDPAAITFAERAHRLAPTDALIQDTLGWLQVQQGDLDAGLKHLREARLRAPANPEIRYHLAAALVRLGRRDEAKQEIREALLAKVQFDGIEDARTLSRDLGVDVR